MSGLDGRRTSSRPGRGLTPRGSRLATALQTAAIAATLALAGCSAGTSSPTNARSSASGPASASVPLTLTVTTEVWTFGQEQGRLLRTPSYRVFTTDNTPMVGARMPEFLEYALATYRSLWGMLPSPSTPLEVYLFATRPQWESFTRQNAGPRADIYLRIQRGGYSENARAVFYNIGPRDTFAIAAHEGWHQFTQATFREPLPIWLEEGISVCMEGFRWQEQGAQPLFLPWSNLERYDRLRDIVATERLSSLEQLLLQRPQDLLQDSGSATLDYYAQIWALTLFLKEGADGSHREPLHRLLQDAAAGRLSQVVAQSSSPREARLAMAQRTGHAPFAAYFGDIAAASRDFETFVRFIVRPGGRSAVLEGRSPR